MIYRYKVAWCFDDKTINTEGIGFALSFSDAMEKLAEEFGEDEILNVSISYLADGNMIAFDDLEDALLEAGPDHSGSAQTDVIEHLFQSTEEEAE